MPKIIDNLDQQVATAVNHYWTTRKAQGERQKSKGTSDAGLRSAVTGGAQMDGFIDLVTKIILDTGIENKYVYQKKSLELPGFFRPTKEWDLLVIKDGNLVAAVEAKSQVGPSFVTILITGQKKRWEPLLICGPHSEKARLTEILNLFSVISLCLKTAKLQHAR